MGVATRISVGPVLGVALLVACTGGSAAEMEMRRLAASLENDLKGASVELASTGDRPVQTSIGVRSLGLDEAGRLVAQLAFCSAQDPAKPAHCTDSGEQRTSTLESRLDLSRIDPAGIAVRSYQTSSKPGDFDYSAGRFLIVPCVDGAPCESRPDTPGPEAAYSTVRMDEDGRGDADAWSYFALLGTDTPAVPPLVLACTDEDRCGRAVVAIRSLAELAKDLPPLEETREESQDATESNALAARLNASLRGKLVLVRAGEAAHRHAVTDRLSAPARGVLALDYYDCLSMYPPSICGRSEERLLGSSKVTLADLDFDASRARPSSNIREQRDFNIKGAHVRLICKDGKRCFEHAMRDADGQPVLQKTDTDMAFACKSAGECAAMMLALRALAADGAGDTPPPAPPLVIETEDEAKAIAERVLTAHDSGGYAGSYGLKNDVPINLQPRRLRVDKMGLWIDYALCDAGETARPCVFRSDQAAKTARLPLHKTTVKDGLDPEGAYVDYDRKRLALACYPGRLCITTTLRTPALSETRPEAKELLACADAPACERTLIELMALVAWANDHPDAELTIERPSSAPGARDDEAPERVTAPGIVGLWELYVPAPTGYSRWTLEFGADGRYTFTDTSNGASHQGTYEAENGQWSLDGAWTKNPVLPAGVPFRDRGTYRLLSADAMEFVGQLGPAVWKKTSAH